MNTASGALSKQTKHAVTDLFELLIVGHSISGLRACILVLIMLESS